MSKLKDIKTTELARLLGVNLSFISNVKSGRNKFSIAHALKINSHFNIPLYEIRPDAYPKRIFDLKD